jgi:hypothetical protein
METDNKSLLAHGLSALVADGDRPLAGWLAVLNGIVEAGRLLADTTTRAAAYDILLPYADRPDHWQDVIATRNRGAFRVTREGRSWRVALGLTSILVEHRIGMLHLAVLAANPGREIDATELAAGPSALPNAALSRQPVLDRTAIQAYRSRLAQLRDEPSTRADAEREWIAAQLDSAAGFGGRTRRFSDDPERARIAVGKAIRRAIRHISDADALIGAHLSRTVRTGVRCAYLPL